MAEGMPAVTPKHMPDCAAVRERYLRATLRDEQGVPETVLASWRDVGPVHDALRSTAADVLSMAQSGGLPESSWNTDHRIRRACEVLDITPVAAYRQPWAERMSGDERR